MLVLIHQVQTLPQLPSSQLHFVMKCHEVSSTILNNGNISFCFQIKKKYSYPAAAEEERAFPEGLMKFVTRSGFFRRGPNKDGHFDPDTIQTISKITLKVQCGYHN